MLRYIYLFTCLATFVSCSLSPHAGGAKNFNYGEILHDLRPVPEGSSDLREFALSLPIIEVRHPTSIDYVYEMSESAVTETVWELPADGAQGEATIVRLPEHADGSQQIELRLHPYMPEMTGDWHTRYSTLKRTDGGWFVLKAWRKNKVNRVD